MLRWGIGCLLVMLALAVYVLPGAGLWAWVGLLPSLPETPVPQLAILHQPPEPIHAELVSGDDRNDLAVLPARVSGRIAHGSEPGTFQHQWPGVYAEARFRGEAVTVRFDDAVNRSRITLDGGAAGVVEVSRPGTADLRISGLAPGAHDIRMDKISESFSPASFGGFFIPPDGEALPPPAARAKLFEFIGDSDTVGYGGTAQRRDCSAEQVFAATDSTRSFGSLVAAHFNADYRMIARSGIGLVRNYGGGERELVMPIRYARALPDAPDIPSIPEPKPNVIVVALGSNDFGSDLQTNEPWNDARGLRQDFQAALIDLLRARNRANPQALLVLLAFGEYGDELVGAYRAAEASLREDGARTTLVVLPKLDRHGCHWHPSPRDHAMIADRLIAAIGAAESD